LAEAGSHAGLTLLVMVDEGSASDVRPEDETIVGCVAYEPGQECDGDWFIKAVAIQRLLQRQGYGTTLLRSVLTRLTSLSPGGTVYWHVEVGNYGSHKMCERLGAEGTQPPGYGDLAQYAIRLPLG
jgi:RimJ/RimL family protein N-acetyltransferase